jgi:hypothetical protein
MLSSPRSTAIYSVLDRRTLPAEWISASRLSRWPCHEAPPKSPVAAERHFPGSEKYLRSGAA